MPADAIKSHRMSSDATKADHNPDGIPPRPSEIKTVSIKQDPGLPGLHFTQFQVGNYII